MKKLLPALVVALLVASAATADVPPPPPPKGKKYVSVTSEVALGKDITGYVFVQVGSGFGAPKFTSEKVELTEGKAKAMPAGGRRTFVTLFAVPQDVAKGFKTNDELFDALKTNKLKGALPLTFPGTATVSDKVKGDSVKWTYTITAIDAKTGIKTKVEGEGYEEPAANPKKEKPPTQPSMFVAGGAVALALLLGGFWLAGRARRKV